MASVVHVVDPELRQPLTGDELVEIIETGIKFFLFQRGQIPLPYDKLEARGNLGGPNARRGNKTDGRGGDENDENSGWERIKALRVRRKEERKEAKMAKNYQKMLEKEKIVKDTWDELFERLRDILSSPASTSIRDVILMFGPSIFNPKEAVQFNIDPSAVGMVHSGAKVDEFKGKIRGFYKNLIMSSAFTDFTMKQLGATSAHLCVLTDQIISCDNEAWRDANPLQDFKTFGFRQEVIPTLYSVQQQRRVTKKLLCVKLSTNSANSDPCDLSQLRENLFCYQIPLKYRGVRCFKI